MTTTTEVHITNNNTEMNTAEEEDTKNEEETTNPGIGFCSLFPKNSLKYIKNRFQFRPSDVVVATYPKSGTTWTQEIVWQLTHNADLEVSKQTPLTERVPFLELVGPSGGPAATSATPGVRKIEAMPASSTRLITTHMGVDLLPTESLKKPKVIIVGRDVRDVFVSFYHHTYGMNYFNYNGSLDDWFNMWKGRRLTQGDYFDYYRGWYNFGHGRDNVLFMTFEALKAKPKQAVRDIADFIGVDVSDEDFLDRVVRNSSFGTMKANPSVNRLHTIPGYAKDGYEFVREGKALGSKRTMSAEHKDFFDEEIARFERESPLPYLHTSRDYGL